MNPSDGKYWRLEVGSLCGTPCDAGLRPLAQDTGMSCVRPLKPSGRGLRASPLTSLLRCTLYDVYCRRPLNCALDLRLLLQHHAVVGSHLPFLKNIGMECVSFAVMTCIDISDECAVTASKLGTQWFSAGRIYRMRPDSGVS